MVENYLLIGFALAGLSMFYNVGHHPIKIIFKFILITLGWPIWLTYVLVS